MRNRSLSARRAWIEISLLPPALWAVFVALRKESVDRNIFAPSKAPKSVVALRKESVDRNDEWQRRHEAAGRRSPQGERG